MAESQTKQTLGTDAPVPISGRRLALPDSPIFSLRWADQSDYAIGAFRRWAGYKDLGVEQATNGLALLQHVLSFGAAKTSGRTGVHCHLAHVHIVIPTSGRGLFSYDGVVTEAAPGGVIVQHGGTIHDQFDYSYAPASEADNAATPQAVEPAPAGAALASFGFLELFIPPTVADVEIIPPDAVTPADQSTAWDHPYHTPGAHYALQPAQAPAAAFRPVAGHPDLEARDADTWAATGGLVATWIIRPASGDSASGDPAAGPPVDLEISGETGGVVILYMVAGSAQLRRDDGEAFVLKAGDTLTHSQGLVGAPFDASPDMRLLRFFIAAKAAQLQERTPDEIERLEALGPAIITARALRPEGDARPINFLHDGPKPRG